MNIMVVILLSGCSFELEPQNLIESPRIEKEQLDIKRAATRFMPKSGRYAIPVEAKGANSINLVDLDGDGTEEIVVFYESMEEYFKTGAYVLKKSEGGWNKIDQIEGDGLYLLSAQFKDLVGNSQKEIVFCWYLGEEEYKNLEIYSMDDSGFYKAGQIKCSDYEIGDLDDDGKDEIISVKLDSKKGEHLAEYYSYEGDKLYKVNEVSINSLSKRIRKISLGNVNDKLKGVVIDFDAGIRSAYTNILYVRDGKMKKAFSDQSIERIESFQIFPMGSYDVDGDGLIEVGIPIPIFSFNSSDSYLEYIQSWYNWDVKFRLKRQYYVDEESLFRVEIPKSWYGRFSLKKTFNKDENIVSFYYTGKDINYMREIMSIHVINPYSLDSKRVMFTKQGRKYEIIEKSVDKVYIVVEPESRTGDYPSVNTKYQSMVEMAKDIKKYFTLIEN